MFGRLLAKLFINPINIPLRRLGKLLINPFNIPLRRFAFATRRPSKGEFPCRRITRFNGQRVQACGYKLEYKGCSCRFYLALFRK